ncbi:MAG: DUF3048 domain-containing protein [Clostridiales Family XIII bacterium]|jgi:hypothetical protein|nr:DUF3048 domain-containing protein [Clostridiales Family XIII bacterium]
MKKIIKLLTVAAAALLVAASLAGCGGGDSDADGGAAGGGGGTANEEKTVYYPLTGEAAPNEAATVKRIISVKIENTPEARPQLGLTRADVVYESLTEGGITRFNCLYQSDVPDEVGPVRSARDSDMSIVPEYNAFFFFSGANDLVWARLATTSISEMSHNSASALYHRVDYRAAPHNLYLDLGKTYDQAAKMGYDTIEHTPRTLEFGPLNTEGREAVLSFQVPFSSADYNVDWSYEDGAYKRSIRGEPQVDEAEGAPQVAPQNVVILWQEYVPAADIPGKGQTYNIDMTGKGTCRVYRDGVKIDGTWSSDGGTPPRFTDASGEAIPLAAGQTWFEIVPTGTEISETSAADTAAAAEGEAEEAA